MIDRHPPRDQLKHLTDRARLVAMALLGLFAMIINGVPAAAAQQPRNVIILFADGAAATQWDFGRQSSKILRGQSFAATDVVFKEGALGLLVTSSANTYITDSAAAGSAMSTGHKVDNGAVAMTPDGRPVPTLMEMAKRRGKRIGLVTNATIYDATPAGFSVHARSRRDYQTLVDQYLLLEPEVLMGGGADYFLPEETDGGRRTDGMNVIEAFRAKGYRVARNPAELNRVTGSRLLGLFALGDMDFEVDRDPSLQPSTAEMTAAALKALSHDNREGFVLLVENENIDTAGHANDAASLMRALWALDDAVKVALEFQRKHPETLVLVTGDHETGGFSPTYAMRDTGVATRPGFFTISDEQFRMLERITMSFGKVREKLGRKPSGQALDELVARHFPGFRLDGELRGAILSGKILEHNFSYVPQNVLGRMVARQTGFYWGTSGHTPEPVPVGAIGPGAEAFRGYQDNTDFARRLHRLIGER